MAAFVLDVTACMPWCCEDEATPASEQLLQRAALRHPLHVPSIWPWEMVNAVRSAVRRKRITPEKAAGFLALLPDVDFEASALGGTLEIMTFCRSCPMLTPESSKTSLISKAPR